MNRRQLLAATGVSLPTLLSGCLGNGSGEPGVELIADGGATPTPESHGPVRGESDADVTVREVEDDENIEYLPEENTIRYIAAWRVPEDEELEDGKKPTREPVYETTPFERWAETQSLSAAARAAAEHVNDELDTDEVGGGVTANVEGQDRAAIVSITTVLNRDGRVIHEPSVDFETVVSTTPKSVGVTYVFGEKKTESVLPVYVSADVLRQQ